MDWDNGRQAGDFVLRLGGTGPVMVPDLKRASGLCVFASLRETLIFPSPSPPPVQTLSIAPNPVTRERYPCHAVATFR